jgi:uncharacterized membrane protein
MKTSQAMTAAIFGLGLACASTTVSGQTWTYVDRLIPEHASADGRVVVGSSVGGSARWTLEGGLQVFGTEPGFGVNNRADAVSGDGTTIFGYSSRSSTRTQLYRWTGPGTFQGLGNAVNAQEIVAEGANHDGSVVVGTVSAAQGAIYQAFVWTPQSGVQPIPGVDSFSKAKAVSGDGLAIAGSRLLQSGDVQAYIWSAALGLRTLRPLDGTFSEAEDMTSDASIVVGVSSSGMGGRATMWLDGTPRSLGVLENYVDSRAISVSDDGSIVTGYCIVQSGPVGPDNHFVWTEAWGMLGVTEFLGRYGVEVPTGMYFDRVKVSGDGRTIYGLGAFSAGNSGTFVFTIPTPGSLMVLGGLSMVVRQGRRK